MRKILFGLFCLMMLCGCTGKASFVAQPSAVPEKRITKTAVPPVTKPTDVLPIIKPDPWQYCASVIVSGSFPEKVSEIENEELRICLINGVNNCAEKLDFTTEPNEAMQSYCADEAMEGAILGPLITGINSPYEWRCHEGSAQITAQIAEPDTDGYDKSIWCVIPEPGE